MTAGRFGTMVAALLLLGLPIAAAAGAGPVPGSAAAAPVELAQGYYRPPPGHGGPPPGGYYPPPPRPGPIIRPPGYAPRGYCVAEARRNHGRGARIPGTRARVEGYVPGQVCAAAMEQCRWRLSAMPHGPFARCVIARTSF